MQESNSNLDFVPIKFHVITPKLQDDKKLVPCLKLSLVVDIKTGQVTGLGQVYNTERPDVIVISNLQGNWSYQRTSETVNIVLLAKGFGPLFKDNVAQMGNVENLRVHIHLANNWRTGVAQYEFLYEECWTSIDNGIIFVDGQCQAASSEQLTKVQRIGS
ncbi:DUF1842 domain-containing protein [Pseudoalteromonas xiamenensis]